MDPEPPTQKRRVAKAQRRRESCRRLHRTARSRSSDDGREPLGQETAPKTSFRSNFLAQRPALSERRPRRFSFPFNSWNKLGRTDVPKARRPVRSPAAMDACIRSRRASHRRQAIPDRLSFCRKETEAPYRLSHRPFASLRYWVGGWICAYLRDLRFLRVSRSGSIWVICGQLSVPSVPLWFF